MGDTLAFVERFALASAEEREAAVRAALTPGSEPHDYYSLLRLQAAAPDASAAAEFAAEEALVAEIQGRRKARLTPRLRRLLFRHQLRRFDRAQGGQGAARDEVFKALAALAGASFQHRRQAARHEVAVQRLPSALDESAVGREAILARLGESRGGDALCGVANTGEGNLFLCQAAAAGHLTERQVDALLARLDDPLAAGPEEALVRLVAENMTGAKKRSFGSHRVHGVLTLRQLDALGALVPDLRGQDAFLDARLLRMRPEADLASLPTGERAAHLRAMYDYVRSLGQPFYTHQVALLHERLRVESAAGAYDFAAFDEYLRLPRRSRCVSRSFAESMRQQLGGGRPGMLGAELGSCGVPAVGDDRPLIERFLRRHFENPREESLDRFSDWLGLDLLRTARAVAKAGLYGGPGPVTAAAVGAGGARAAAASDEDERARAVWLEDLPEGQRRSMRDEVRIEFDERNPEHVDAEDAVTLALFAKNAGRLSVRVFEINAKAYCRDRGAPVPADVELDGLTPHAELAADLSGASPFSRVPVLVPLPSLAGRRGTFVVDVLGNGKNCRALVRKGRVLFVERRTVAGHVFRLLDEHLEPVRGGGRVWIDGRAYEADPERREVIVPYSASAAGARTVVLEDDDTAEVVQFEALGERFAFEASVHVDREALLEKREAEAVVRASLTLNGAPAPLGMLEKARVEVHSEDGAGIQSSAGGPVEFGGEAGEAVFRFPVADRLRRVRVVVTAELRRASDGRTERFSHEHAVACNATADESAVDDVHLRRAASGYWLLALGAGGEPRPGLNVTVGVAPRLLGGQAMPGQALQSDARGRVFLGDLRGAASVSVAAAGRRRTFEIGREAAAVPGGAWAGRRAAYPRLVQLVQGEGASLAYGGDGRPGDATLVRLVPGGGPAAAEDHTARHLAVDATAGYLTLSDALPAGAYVLRVRSDEAAVHVRVLAGQVVFGRYVLSRTELAELSARRGASQPVQVASVLPDGRGGLAVRVSGHGPSTRVHVVASHFAPGLAAAGLHAGLGAGVPGPDPVASALPPRRPNRYLKQRDLSDEQQYVLDRRLAEKRVGNMLQRPSLLLAPRVARETSQADAPKLREATAFSAPQEQMACAAAPSGMMFGSTPVSKRAARCSESGAGVGGLRRGRRGALNGPPALDFLAAQSARLFNLRPSADGVVEVPADALGRTRTHVTVVAVNGPGEAASCAVALEDPVLNGAAAAEAAAPVASDGVGGGGGGGDDEDLDGDVEMGGATNELRLADPSAYYDTRMASGLGRDAHVTEQHLVSVLGAGETLRVRDIKTAKVVTYDRLQDAYDLLATLLRGPAADALRTKLDFLPRWAGLAAAEREEKYSRFASHELNFFLWRRDRAFFDRVVRPHLGNKAAHLRTFMDEFLLGLPVRHHFDEPWRFERLNAAEKVLLGTRLDADGRARVARYFADLQEALPVDQRAFVTRFETALRVKASVEPPEEEPEPTGGAGGNAPPPPPPQAAPAPAAMNNAFGGGGPRFGGARMRRGGGGATFGAAPQVEKVKRKSKKQAAAFRFSAGEVDDDDDEEVLDDMLVEAEACDEDMGSSSDSSDGNPLGGADDAYYMKARDQVKQLYKAPENTKEYEETGYLLAGRKDTARLVPVNNFWANYASHALGEAGEAGRAFVSPNLAEAAGTFEEAALALAVLDLPLEAAGPPRVLRAGLAAGEAFEMEAPGACLVFHKEMRETPVVPSSVSVAQSYYDPADRYAQDRDEGRVDKYVVGNEFLANKVYHCRVVITNVSSVQQRASVLLQLPEGSLPVGGVSGPAFRTDTRFATIGAFSTTVLEYGFYFPAPGQYEHYPVHVSKRSSVVGHGQAQTLRVVTRTTAPPDLASWQHVSQNGTGEQLLDFLRERNVHRESLPLMLWRFRPGQAPPAEAAALFARVLDVLRSRCVFSAPVWAYALALGGPDEAVREYLAAAAGVSGEAGPFFTSSLLSVDAFDRLDLTHLEYSPLINARAHRLRARGGAGSAETPDLLILNRQLKAQYTAYLEYLAHRGSGLGDPAVPAAHAVALVYYLLAQDRVADALDLFEARLAGRDAAALGVPAMQLDLVSAYLGFYTGRVEEAAATAARYAAYPVASWKRKFDQVAQQAAEVQGAPKKRAVPAASRVDGDDAASAELQRAMADDAGAAEEPFLDAEVVGGELRVRHRHLAAFRVNLYFVDAESAFSAQPFDATSSSRQLYVAPNESERVEAEAGGTTSYRLPERGNMYVEVAGDGAGASHLGATLSHFSNSFSVQALERLGQVRVTDHASDAAVPRCYVKVYARVRGRVEFWKDGYTDLRGRFDYASVSGGTAGRLAQVSTFSVLVLDERLGAVVKEVKKPAM